MKKILFALLILIFILPIQTFSEQKSVCGNGICEYGESIDNCSDCNLFQSNNNGVCGFQESPQNAPADCNTNCGDGICEDRELYTCPKDCLGKGSLLTKEKTNFNSAVMFYYNGKFDIKDSKPYIAYMKNGKTIDYYFDTLILIDQYFRADNIEEWLEFPNYNFIDNYNYKVKWLSKEENNNIALISEDGDIKSNAIYQNLNLKEGKYELSYDLYSTNSDYNNFILGLIFYDKEDKQIMNKDIGLNYSNYLNSYFKYPEITNDNWKNQKLSFFVPKNTKYVKIYFQFLKTSSSLSNPSYKTYFEKKLETKKFKLDNIVVSKLENNNNFLCNGNFDEGSTCWNNLYPQRNINHIMKNANQSPIKIIDKIMEETNKELKKNKKLNIIIAIPWGFKQFEKGMSEFKGIFNRIINPSKREELFKSSLKEYVDKTIKLWNNTKIDNLNLVGFYLDDEGASPSSTQEEWLSYLHTYLGSKNLKLYASPYNALPYKEQYNKYLKGYYIGKNSWPENLYKYADGLFSQPNIWPPTFMWPTNYDDKKGYSLPHRINTKDPKNILPNEKSNPSDPNSPVKDVPSSNFCLDGITPEILARNGIPPCEISKTINYAYRNNIGIELEWTRGLEENLSYGRKGYGIVRDYMSYIIDYGLLKSSFLFYEAGGYLLSNYNSNNPVYRKQYDEVYQFIKKSRE